MFAPLLAGLGLGFSLIIAIGAQNLFVLRQGLRKELVVLVAAICAASDAALIALGVSGIGLVVNAMPWLFDAVRWAGALFLVGYGLLAARRAGKPPGHTVEKESTSVADPASAVSPASASDTNTVTTGILARTRALPVVLTCLALTWLNPHVYLDTVFLLGTIANTHGDARWIFAIGAMSASVVWFFALALGARYLGRWLGTPRAWRILDAVIAVVMVVMGVSLVLPH